jgi:hypothetical protein
MKNNLLFFLFSSFMMFPYITKSQSGDRKDLHDLVELRRERFDSYSRSLEKRSGIFGNKSKKDIQRSNEVLMGIVEIDNRIISTLNRVIDYKSYEKVNRNYDWMQNNDQVSNLRQATDTLTKQVDQLAITNAQLKTKTKKLRWIAYILSALLIWSLISKRKKKPVGM